MNTIWYIIGLVIGGLIFVAGEICIPSLGLMAIGAIACLGWAVYLAFKLNGVFGLLLLGGLLVFMPFYLWLVARFLPQTAVGRLLSLQPPKKPPGEGTPEATQQQALVGQSAVAETDLRPSGAIRIGGERLIATAETGYVRRGATVEILKAIGTNVIVREIKTPV